MNKIAQSIKRATQTADRMLGMDAMYTSLTIGDMDIATGVQSTIRNSCKVRVRSYPLSARELAEFASAGISQDTTRWLVSTASLADVQAGDLMRISGIEYEVTQQPESTIDEFGVTWTIFTRRSRSLS